MRLPETTEKPASYIVAVCILLGLFLPGLASAGLAEGIAAFERMDYDTAMAELDELASSGNSDACYLLGMLHDPGFHRLPSGKFYQTSYFDVDKAVALYQKAIDAGDGRAMHRLAELYLLLTNEHWATRRPDGIGNLTNTALALRHRSTPLLRALADEGDAIAAYMLAEARRDDSFFFIAMDNARNMLELAAWRDNPVSQLYLGRTFLFPRGMVVRSGYTLDPPEAFAWFTVSAKKGNMHARVYQMEAAEMMPIREYGRAEELTRALLKSLAAKSAKNPN
jgi:TPR repeat protein